MDKVNRFVAWTLLVIALLIGIGRLVAFRWWQVPMGDPELEASIVPTLRGGDWVLLWNLTRPGPGDLVMCPDPDDPSNVVIGRIMGQAGDEVVIDKQEVFINGAKPHIEYNCTENRYSLIDPDTLKEAEVFCDMEDIDGSLHMRGYIGEAFDKKKRPRYTRQVDANEVFLVSDNRAFPFDSRHYGNLVRTTCKETIFFRIIGKEGFFEVERRFQYVR